MLYKIEISKRLIEFAPHFMQLIKPHVRKASESRLTHTQYRVMANIYRGLNTVTEIASHHGVSQPTMTKIINAMVKKKWIKKKANPADRRQTSLILTAQGFDLFMDVRGEAQMSLGAEVEKLSKAELAQIENSLKCLESIIPKLKMKLEGNSL